MLPRVRLIALLTATSAVALFPRRKSGWLGELDGIRQDALAQPTGEVAVAMADVEPLPPVGADVPPPPPSVAGEPALDEERSPLAELEAPLPPARVAVEPAPHPIRPQEMWHPGVIMTPVEGGQATPAASLDVEAEIERSLEEAARSAAESALPAPPVQAPPPPIADLFDAPEAVATVPAPTGFGEAPLVPPASTIGTGTLIDGPVARRNRRERPSLANRGLTEPPHRDHRGSGSMSATLAAGPVVVDGPPPVPEVIVGGDVPAASLAAPEPPMPQALPIDHEGRVALDHGTLRLSPELRPEVRLVGSEVAFAIAEGWAWTALPAGSRQQISVTLPLGMLTIGGDTTVLTSVEDDGTCFVVVVGGEAVLQHPAGRMRLRTGAMVLAPPGAEPQADVASLDEIAADPLVALNQGLDARR